MTGKIRLLIRLALLASLVAVGVLAASFFKAGEPTETTLAVVESSHPQRIEIPREAIAVPNRSLERETAEKLMRKDRYKRAIPHLLNAAPEQIEEADEELLFRISLCFEASGDFERADQYYSKLMERTTDQYLAAGCRNGIARCRIQNGNLTSGRRMVWSQYMLADRQNTENPFTKDALNILALSFGIQNDENTIPLLNDNALIQGLQPQLSVSRQLALLDSTLSREANLAESSETRTEADVTHGTGSSNTVQITHIMKAGESPEDFFASYSADRVPLEMLMQWTMTKLGIEIAITERAREIAETQTISMDLDHVSLPTVLDIQTLPFGLGWRIKEGATTIFALEEVDPNIGYLIRRNAAVRIINRVILLSPSHIHSAYMRFQLAGLYFQLDSVPQALALHQDLIEGKPLDSLLRRAVQFNLGQMQARYGDPDYAIESYEKVVDSNKPGEIKTVAWLRIGQTHVQTGDHDRAVTAFLRASRSSNRPYYRELSALGMASSYLISGKPELAKEALSDSVSFLRGSELEQAARFLRAFYEFESSEQDLESSQILLSSLASLNWPEALGSSGELLKARAWERLKFPEEAARSLRKIVQQSKSEWLTKRSVDQLSQLLIDEKRWKEAKDLLIATFESSKNFTSPKLKARLAYVSFELGDHEASLQLCNEILTQPSNQQVYGNALKTMGRIYQNRGDHYTAALCFSGVAPGERKWLTAENPR